MTDKKHTKIPDRVISFSVKPTDTEALLYIANIKQHSKKTGISFSYFMLKALKQINQDITK